MPKFIADLLDLLRFRFQPLSHYVYPAWQPLGWLALAAILGGSASTEVQAALPGKLAFFFVLTLAETAFLSIWLMVWWKWVLRRPFTGSLFPLLTLCTGPQFLVPLVALLPPRSSAIILLTIAIYNLVLMVSAVAAALEERRRTVLLGMMAYLPLALIFSQLTHRLMAGWGWIAWPVAPVGS
ncbi:hypothetical protein SAMN05660284_01235 [Formivibrio citricus]|uniref:Yip1 domain-containing protein n=1 Tax=Formivibrio citricus TaxID=83765 RepID=A0A1I4Y606_9NEIS|nr:hypothetical protein [Formivibrio citricus]SFN33504.1 hypothetical protein SAMN05660284_01235 [Formivibrio citricus]